MSAAAPGVSKGSGAALPDPESGVPRPAGLPRPLGCQLAAQAGSRCWNTGQRADRSRSAGGLHTALIALMTRQCSSALLNFARIRQKMTIATEIPFYAPPMDQTEGTVSIQNGSVRPSV